MEYILFAVFAIWAIKEFKKDSKTEIQAKELAEKVKQLEFEKRMMQGADVDYLELPNNATYEIKMPIELLEDFQHHCKSNNLNEWHLIKSYMVAEIKNKKSEDNEKGE